MAPFGFIGEPPIRVLELLAACLSNVAARGSNPRPHGKEENRDPEKLRQTARDDRQSQCHGRGMFSRQLSGNPRRGSHRYEPVSRGGEIRIVSVLAALGAGKQPQRHPQDHHHHEPHQDGVGVGAHFVWTGGREGQLAPQQYVGADRESDQQKRNRSLDVTADE